MSDLPLAISITEEGPREGFQIEPGPIASVDKIAFIDALSQTGLRSIQVCSFVSPRLVPGWADATNVVAGFRAMEGVRYTALWFNAKGIERAQQFSKKLHLIGTIHTVASEAFCKSNLNRDRAANLAAMKIQTQAHQAAGIAVTKVSVMAAFGCNFHGDVSIDECLLAVSDGLSIAEQCDAHIREIALADTMGWANPSLIEKVVGAVRERWPEMNIRLHLHETRGLGIANAYAGMRLGVTHFDATAGGLGGCPFATKSCSTGNRAPGNIAPGNIATEELVLLAHESGVETGVDLEALIEAGHLAERVVGHALPSALLRGGSLKQYRQ